MLKQWLFGSSSFPFVVTILHPWITQLYFLWGEVLLLLFLIVNLPTTSTFLSWVAGLPFCKQTWLFHHFCWAIIDNLIPHLSPLSLIKCLISHYLLPNFWLCRIPRPSSHSLLASVRPHHRKHHFLPLAAKTSSLLSSLHDSFLSALNLGWPRPSESILWCSIEYELYLRFN